MSFPSLAAGLDESVHLVGPGGRMLVLAYHSLEDRAVKERFTRWAGRDVPPTPPGLPVEPPRPHPLVRLLTRRPIRPQPEEIADNPRSESARLRAGREARVTVRSVSSTAAVAAPARGNRARRSGALPRSAPAAPPRRRHLRVVAPAPRSRLLPTTMVAAAVATVLVLFGLVVVHVFLAQSQLTLDRLTSQVGTAQNRYEQARLTHAELAAPSRIVARAGQLGLVAPAQPPIPVPVPSSGPSSTRTQTPSAATAP